MNIDERTLQIVGTSSERPLTVGRLARQLGVSSHIVLSAARRLVHEGLADPSFVRVHGVLALCRLLPCPIPSGA